MSMKSAPPIMSQQQRRHFPMALLASFLAGGCKEEVPACFGLSVDERLQISIVERYDASSGFPGARLGNVACPQGIDIASGDTLKITVERQEHDDVSECTGSLFVVEDADEFGWGNARFGSENLAPQVPLLAYIGAEVAGCSALVQLTVDERRSTTNLEAVSEPGQEPYFVLLRELIFSDGCSQSCSDEFVVSITRAP